MQSPREASAAQLFDAVVVGAGPAGTAAAYDIAAAGHSVLLVDRKSFPRLKPCAGGLTIKAVKRLRYSIAPVIRFVARDLDVTLGGSRARRFRSASPIAVMTVREQFDAYCLAQTVKRGALFRRVRDLASLNENAEGVTLVMVDGEAIHARFAIGADGVSSRVRRLIGAGQAARALAVEGCIRSARGCPGATMRFDFGCLPGGYGWMFPKGDHLNVGLYTQRPGVSIAKSDLVKYVRNVLGGGAVGGIAVGGIAVCGIAVGGIVGHPIGVGGEHYRATAARRVLLAGDAAGMAERLLGEGIHNAIKSGQAAAATVLASLRPRASGSQPYGLSLQELQRDLATCSSAAEWFYGIPRLGFAALASLPARTALMRGFAAGKTLREIKQSFAFAPFYRIEEVRSITQFERAGSSTRISP